MRIRHIDRTATVAWSPGQHPPLLAVGTVAGALDASFSTTTELEILDLNLSDSGKSARQLRRMGVANANARFNRIAWGSLPDPSKPYGIVAGGMENGELDLWNPKGIIDGEGQKALLMRQSTHTGQVRGLDFNPLQSNLLASGATDGEIFIWDLNNPTKPYSPGARSAKLEDVTALSWNRVVAHILATGSNNGYTVVWDLRNRREIIQLAHPGGRKPIMGVAWNPELPTQVVTASDDDHNPVLFIWDLRNARAPEKVLEGHQKGVLSVAWCSRDSDLLLSCGKDNSTLAWNTTSGKVIGELSHSSNWAFDVQWCPRNPDLVTVASFDGKVSVHSLQAAGTPEEPDEEPIAMPAPDPNDPFANIAYQNQYQHASSSSQFVLTTPPKWLKRPVGVAWGFGGKLVTFDAQSKRAVFVRTIPTSPHLASRIDELEHAIADGRVEAYMDFCEKRAAAQDEGDAVTDQDREMWRFLKVLLEPDAREKIVRYLGFSKDNVGQDRLAGLLQKLKVTAHKVDDTKKDEKTAPTVDGIGGQDKPNGLTGLFAADGSDLDAFPVSGEQQSIPTVANDPFSLYPTTTRGEEADVDTLLTRCLILGDFETALDVALGANRLSDALMIGVSGGPELLARAQSEYFKRTRTQKSYARVLKSVIDGDLLDIVHNAALDGKDGGWKDILALICTYGKPENVGELFGILGRRLEKVAGAGGKADTTEAKKFAAALCYLGAGDLAKIVSLWTRREEEEEGKLLAGAGAKDRASVSAYASHLLALQSLIEKVTIFRKAIGFVDSDAAGAASGNLKLESLYARYAEYAQAVAAQGRVDFAWSILELVPEGFRSAQSGDGHEDDVAVLKDRAFRSGGLKRSVSQQPAFPYEAAALVEAVPVQQQQTQPQYYPQGAQAGYPGQTGGYYSGYQPQQQAQPTSYPPAAATGQYAGAFGNGYYPGQQPPATPAFSNPPATPAYPGAPAAGGFNFGPPPAANTASFGGFPGQTTGGIPPPPMGGAGDIGPPPTSKMNASNLGGYGDAPVVQSAQRHLPKPPPPTSPFPNATPSAAAPASAGWQQQQTSALPPPPPTGGYTPTPFARQASPAPSPAPGRRTPGFPPVGPPPTTGFGGQQSAPVPPPPTQGFAQQAQQQNFGSQGQQGFDHQSGSGYPQQQQYPGAAGGQQGYPNAGFSGYPQQQQQQAPPPMGPDISQRRSSSLVGAGAGMPGMGRPASTPPVAAQNVGGVVSPPPSRTPAPGVGAAASSPPVGGPKYPPGDRSHIPAAQKPLYESLLKHLNIIRSLSTQPQQKKIFDDAEKKMNIMFDQMNAEEIPQDILERMSELVKALDARDFTTAQKIQVELLTTRFDATGRWMLGVKRLIDFTERASAAGYYQ
ncbi:protein transport protein S31 [Borealophlyctis nickersoniae]|nr:protein transport protein S31 [Borealophlyctis nickersoniae]